MHAAGFFSFWACWLKVILSYPARPCPNLFRCY